MPLSQKEVDVLNMISKFWPGHFKFGTRLQSLLADVTTGTPVNAVNATGVLTLTGVVKDSETFTISNPARPGSNVYEFLTDAAQTKTASTNKAVDISASAVKASGTLTLAAQPTAGDTMTIGAKLYTFVADGQADADGKISVGADLAAAKVNVVAAINGTDSINTAHPLVTAAAFSSNDCTITALIGGTVGNTISTVETFTSVSNVFADATLENGADCSAANAITALVAAVNAQDTQYVAAAAGTGTTVDFTADVAGVAGNNIAVSDTMANASFGAAKLSGGVDGTIGSVAGTMIDASYVYYCVADNTISGKNWRRVSLGDAF